jgi:hypothetical protein
MSDSAPLLIGQRETGIILAKISAGRVPMRRCASGTPL